MKKFAEYVIIKDQQQIDEINLRKMGQNVVAGATMALSGLGGSSAHAADPAAPAPMVSKNVASFPEINRNAVNFMKAEDKNAVSFTLSVPKEGRYDFMWRELDQANKNLKSQIESATGNKVQGKAQYIKVNGVTLREGEVITKKTMFKYVDTVQPDKNGMYTLTFTYHMSYSDKNGKPVDIDQILSK